MSTTKNNNSSVNKSSISYTGKVTVKKYDTKRKKVISTQIIKNAGTKNLFKFLCECLIGNYTLNNRPRYLDASHNAIQSTDGNATSFSSNLYYRSILNNSNLVYIDEAIPLSTGETLNVSYPHIRYSCTILRGQLDSDALNEGINSLVLCNSPSINDTSDSILAWISLNEDETITIENNQALLIEWDLSFDNYISNSLNNGI